MVSYPPEPWHLSGDMHVSLWAVPRAHLPPLPSELAAVARPVTAGGRGFVGTAWVDYGPGGVLQYRELLSAVLVRRGRRPLVTIVDIWVDSLASRDGGRELWGIPKELADLDLQASDADLQAGDARATAGGTTIARARTAMGARLPGRWPARFSVVQVLDGRVKTTAVRARTAVRVAKAAWRIPPDSPLAYLSGRRPLLTVALRDFRLTFGG